MCKWFIGIDACEDNEERGSCGQSLCCMSAMTAMKGRQVTDLVCRRCLRCKVMGLQQYCWGGQGQECLWFRHPLTQHCRGSLCCVDVGQDQRVLGSLAVWDSTFGRKKIEQCTPRMLELIIDWLINGLIFVVLGSNPKSCTWKANALPLRCGLCPFALRWGLDVQPRLL